MTEPAQQSTNRSTIFGVLAVMIAAGTGVGAWWVISSYQEALETAKRPGDMQEVLAATHDLGPGEVLSEADLVLVQVASDSTTTGQFFTNRDDLLGDSVAERILAGEPIRRERIDDGLGLDDATLEPGTRAVTLRVDRAAGVGGLIMPGAYVDVIVTIRPDENALNAQWVTETIMQAVRVLAVGDSSVAARTTAPTTGPKPKPSNDATRSRELFATLEVEPDEAEKLAMATTRGDVYLALRPRNEFDLIADTKPLVTNALVGIDGRPSPARAERLERRRVAVAAPPGTQAEVISGSSTTIQHFGPQGSRVVDPKKEK